MSEMMNNVKTINSAVRTMLMVGVAGVVGVGSWFGYDHYVKPGFEAKKAKADLQSLQVQYHVQSEEMRRLTEINDRLETAMKLLKVDRRIANVKVMETGTHDDGEPFMEVRFTEVDESGQTVGSSRDFTLQGNKVYVDGWVVTFEDRYVENADELRSASLFVFKSIYGDAERPIDAQPLDTQTEKCPPGIYKSEKQTKFEQQIWSDFWKVTNDRSLQKEMGIRAAQGQASYMEAEEGKTYQVNIRASGSMSLTPIEEVKLETDDDEGP